MALLGRLASVSVLVVLVTACSFGGGAVLCSTDDQCVGAAGAGHCELNSFCSFPDSSCASGRSYGSQSGSLSNVCFGDPMPDANVAGADGPPDSQIDAPDAPPQARPFCDDANEPSLVGCWQFEGVLTDASGDNNNGIGTSASFTAGKVGMAVQLAANSHIAVADSASLAPASLTIEAWINVSALPLGRFGILDNDGSYGFFVTATGLQCTNVAATVTIVPGQWTHVACTFDGTGRIYLGGSEIAMMPGGAPLGAGNANGSAIGGNSPTGDPFVGMIDQVRVWNVARTPTQICNAAGAVVCP